MQNSKYGIKNKEEFLQYLREDKKALFESYRLTPDSKTKPKIFPRCEIDYIYKFQYMLRRLEYRNNCKNSSFLDRVYNKLLGYLFFKEQIRTGMFLQPNCFGPGLVIKHIGPMIISGGVKIGRNCHVHPFCNIGVNGSIHKVGQIGDNVYLGNGCKIIGEVYLGNNIVVGAGAVVTKSYYEDHVVLGGCPAKVISKKGSEDFPYF